MPDPLPPPTLGTCSKVVHICFLSLSLIYTIHPWKLHLSHRICHSFLKEGGGPGKTTLSLLKDVTIRLRREGVQGKRDNVTLYDVFFFDGALNLKVADIIKEEI